MKFTPGAQVWALAESGKARARIVAVRMDVRLMGIVLRFI
jgi:hypothetical protein